MSKNTKRRYREHCRKSSVPVSKWVQELKEQGLRPFLRVIEEDILGEVAVWEREGYWESFFLAEGAQLLNSVSQSIREKYAQNYHERTNEHGKLD